MLCIVVDTMLIRIVSVVDVVEVLTINQTSGVKGMALNAPVLFAGKKET